MFESNRNKFTPSHSPKGYTCNIGINKDCREPNKHNVNTYGLFFDNKYFVDPDITNNQLRYEGPGTPKGCEELVYDDYSPNDHLPFDDSYELEIIQDTHRYVEEENDSIKLNVALNLHRLLSEVDEAEIGDRYLQELVKMSRRVYGVYVKPMPPPLKGMRNFACNECYSFSKFCVLQKLYGTISPILKSQYRSDFSKFLTKFSSGQTQIVLYNYFIRLFYDGLARMISGKSAVFPKSVFKTASNSYTVFDSTMNKIFFSFSNNPNDKNKAAEFKTKEVVYPQRLEGCCKSYVIYNVSSKPTPLWKFVPTPKTVAIVSRNASGFYLESPKAVNRSDKKRLLVYVILKF